MNQNDSNQRVVIVGSGPTDIALLRAALADRCDVILADRAPALPKYTSAAGSMDKAIADGLRREQEIRDWNAAVDAKKVARQERRIERRWSRA